MTTDTAVDRQLVADAFAAWAAGTSPITALFAPDMRWEIVGRSAAAGVYGSAQEFIDRVLQPFGARFTAQTPFRPVRVRAIHTSDDEHTVAIVWDGEGVTTLGTTYRNTYAWFLTFRDGRVVDATAFFDSIAFDELWSSVTP